VSDRTTADTTVLQPVASTRRRLLGPSSVETATFCLSLLTGPVVSRAVGDDGRGNLAAVVVPLQLLVWVLYLGVPYGSAMLVREVPRRLLVDSTWRLVLLVQVPVAAVGWFVAPWLLADHPDVTVDWFRVGLLCLVVAVPAITGVHLRLIESGGTWRTSLATQLYLVLYTASVVVLAVLDELRLETALAAWVLSFVGGYAIVVAAYRVFPRSIGDRRTMARQLRSGRPQAVVTLATISLGRLDQVFLAALGSSASLGHYAVAATAAQVSLPIANGVATVVMPDAFQRGDSQLQRSATRLVFRISLAIGVLSAITAPWVLPFVFGSDFHDSVALLWWMLPGQVLFNTAWVANASQLGKRRGGDAARAIGAAAVAYALLLGPVVSWAGAAGAAALTSACQGLFLLGVVVRGRSTNRAVDDRADVGADLAADGERAS
jgi:O-antigen/teichoic acid export membrane protein